MYLNQWCYILYNADTFRSKIIQEVLKSITVVSIHCTFVLVRAQMGTVDVKVSCGQLDVLKEKNLLVWVLGKCCFPAQS